MNRRFTGWLLLAALVIVADQATKLLAESHLLFHEPVRLLPVLSLTLSYNQGAAFSFLGSASGWQRWFFILLALGVSLVLIAWLRRLGPGNRWLGTALSLVLGGALGNVIDRFAYGHVIDFIDAHYQHWHWPIFNVADSAISVGVVMLLVHSFLGDRSRDRVEE